jgi:hypothetical protein
MDIKEAYLSYFLGAGDFFSMGLQEFNNLFNSGLNTLKVSETK